MSSNKKTSIRLTVPRTSLRLPSIGASALPLLAALALSTGGGGCTTFDELTATAQSSTGTSGSGGATNGAGGGGTASTGSAGGMGGGGGAGIDCGGATQKGSIMVPVHTKASAVAYCIDISEVTRGQYQNFLDSSPELNQPSPCDNNTDFVPQGEWPPKNKEKKLPVVYIDQCDAAAYCAWAGKRLCGAIGGGGTNLDGAADPAASQWMNACSDGGKLAYPYGTTYQSSSCNGLDYGMFSPINIMTEASCEGGVPGLFDMSGNVREWEDACSGDDCAVRGGSYKSSGAADGELPCGNPIKMGRYSTDVETGFRCCKN